MLKLGNLVESLPPTLHRLHYFLFLALSALLSRLLIFSVVNSSSSNPTWTNSLGPIREYFYALPVTSALSLCTTISSLFLLGSFGLPCFPVLFSFIAFLNFFHLSALSAIFVYPRPQVILVYGNDRQWRFFFSILLLLIFILILYYFLLSIKTLLNLIVLIKYIFFLFFYKNFFKILCQFF